MVFQQINDFGSVWKALFRLLKVYVCRNDTNILSNRFPISLLKIFKVKDPARLLVNTRSQKMFNHFTDGY